MPTFSKIDGAEPSTVTFSLASVTQDRGGVTAHQEIVTLGGTESTLAVAQVRAGDPASTEWALAVRQVGLSTQALRVAQSTAADLNVTVAGYVAPSTIVTVSTGSVRVHQSSAGDLNVTVAGYVAPSTLQTVRQSTYTDFNGLMRLADRDQSTQTAAVLGGVPPSSAYGLVVRMPAPINDSTNNALRVNVVAGAAGGSTIVTVSQLLDSSGGSVTAADSANNAIRVNVVAGAAGGSTVVTVNGNASSNSSLYLPVRLTNGTAFLTASQDYADASTASNLAGPVLTYDNGTNATMRAVSVALGLPVRNYTSSGGGVEGSTTAPAAGVIGLHVREALQDLLSTRAVITSSNSTALYTLVSSAAGLKHKVYVYSLTSTETTPSTLVFMSSNAIDRWAVSFGSGSSGVTGANLSVSPPSYIFKTDAANALRCLIEKGASTQCIVSLSFGYFSEP
jgi:hypothetical protein